MFMDEKEKLILENLKDDKKTFWVIFTVLTGGLAGILLSLNSLGFNPATVIKFSLLLLGSFVWYLLLIRLMFITKKINKYLE